MMRNHTGIFHTWYKSALLILAVWLFCFCLLPPNSSLAALEEPQVLLEDQFNTENQGQSQNGFNAFTNWEVTAGGVNLKGNAKDEPYPQHGIYVELKSGSGDPVKLVSKDELELTPGRYSLQMDLAGSLDEKNKTGGQEITRFFGMDAKKEPPAQDPSRVRVQLGQALMARFNVEPGQPFRRVSVEFEVSQIQQANLELTKTDGANSGVLLDNLILSFLAPKQETAEPKPSAEEEKPPADTETVEPEAKESELLKQALSDSTRGPAFVRGSKSCRRAPAGGGGLFLGRAGVGPGKRPGRPGPLDCAQIPERT